MNDSTRRNAVARVCSEHSGLEARWASIEHELRDIRKQLRWLTGAVFAVALLVGGAKFVDALQPAAAMASEPAPITVSE